MLWIHVIAAVVWVGGNLILAMVIVPTLQAEPAACRTYQALDADRVNGFEPVVWGCIGVLFFYRYCQHLLRCRYHLSDRALWCFYADAPD